MNPLAVHVLFAKLKDTEKEAFSMDYFVFTPRQGIHVYPCRKDYRIGTTPVFTE